MTERTEDQATLAAQREQSWYVQLRLFATKSLHLLTFIH
jgi:hypothetical protein